MDLDRGLEDLAVVALMAALAHFLGVPADSQRLALAGLPTCPPGAATAGDDVRHRVPQAADGVQTGGVSAPLPGDRISAEVASGRNNMTRRRVHNCLAADHHCGDSFIPVGDRANEGGGIRVTPDIDPLRRQAAKPECEPQPLTKDAPGTPVDRDHPTILLRPWRRYTPLHRLDGSPRRPTGRVCGLCSTRYLSWAESRGLLRPGVDPEAAAWTWGSILRGHDALRNAYGPKHARVVGEQVVRQFVEGIAAAAPDNGKTPDQKSSARRGAADPTGRGRSQ